MLIGVCVNHRPGGRDQLRREEVVTGQAVLGGEVTDPAAEGEAADASRTDDSPGTDEAERLRGRVEVEPGSATTGASDASVGVDVDCA